MKLYLLRHGPAVSRQEWDKADSERPLTEHGIKVTNKVAQHICDLDLGLDALLTSPYARARDTARIVAKECGIKALLAEEPGLEPDRFTAAELRRILDEHPDAENVMVVGHEPSMSTVASDVIGGGSLRLKKSGLIRIDISNRESLRGELSWLIPPKLH
jgi:phosphohistidine phosphatase